jgi:hypothetical protein
MLVMVSKDGQEAEGESYRLIVAVTFTVAVVVVVVDVLSIEK